MTNSLEKTLVKAIVDLTIFVEFAGDEIVDPDSGIEVIEQLSAELQTVDPTQMRRLLNLIEECSAEYLESEKAEFVRELPDSLGLRA